MESPVQPVAAHRPDSPPGAGGRRASAFLDPRGLVVWLATRLGVVFAGALFADASLKHSFLDRWTQWDAGHLIAIAQYGYAGDPSQPRDGGLVAFFPGFPLLLRAVHLVVPDWRLAALLISLVAGAFAAMALTRMVDAEIPSAGVFATLALLLSPFAVFLFAGYSEALFLAFAFPAWSLARRRRWEAAALCGLAAGTVRITGLFLAIALAIEFLRVERLRWRTMPWMLLPFAGVTGYFAYLWWWSGDMMAWQHAQATHWGRTLTNPLDSLNTTWNAAFGPHDMFTDAFRVELAAAAIGVALTCWLLVRRRWAESAYVGLQMISFLTSSYYLSIGRATLLWWPLWMMLGGLAVRTRARPFTWRLPFHFRSTRAPAPPPQGAHSTTPPQASAAILTTPSQTADAPAALASPSQSADSAAAPASQSADSAAALVSPSQGVDSAAALAPPSQGVDSAAALASPQRSGDSGTSPASSPQSARSARIPAFPPPGADSDGIPTSSSQGADSDGILGSDRPESSAASVSEHPHPTPPTKPLAAHRLPSVAPDASVSGFRSGSARSEDASFQGDSGHAPASSPSHRTAHEGGGHGVTSDHRTVQEGGQHRAMSDESGVFGADRWFSRWRGSGAAVRARWGYWPIWAYCLRLALYVVILGAMVPLLAIEIVHFTEGGWAG